MAFCRIANPASGKNEVQPAERSLYTPEGRRDGQDIYH